MSTTFNQRKFMIAVKGQLYRRGLRIADIAALVGVSRQSLWSWSEGRAGMPIWAASLLAELCDLSMDDYRAFDADTYMRIEQFKLDNPERF